MVKNVTSTTWVNNAVTTGIPMAVVRPHTAKTVTQLALLKVVAREIVPINAPRLAARNIEGTAKLSRGFGLESAHEHI